MNIEVLLACKASQLVQFKCKSSEVKSSEVKSS